MTFKNVPIVAEVKANRSIFFTHPQTKQWRYLRGDKIIPLIKEFYPHKLKTVNIPQIDGTDKNIFTYSFKSKLKDCATEVQIIFIFDKWSQTDDKDVHVLITTNLNMSARSAILTYLLRWGIEEAFRELKDTFCFDQYQVYHQEQIQTCLPVGRDTGLWHSWLGHLLTGLNRTAVYPRFSTNHLKLSVNASEL